MRVYLFRRLLLLVPTLLGITAVCFTLIQFVPGGPVEELIARVRAQSSMEGGGGSTTQQQITEEEIENIRAYYGFDKPALTRYFEWLGTGLGCDQIKISHIPVFWVGFVYLILLGLYTPWAIQSDVEPDEV